MNEFKKFWKNWAKTNPTTPATASLKFIDVSIPASTMTRTANIVDLPKHLREYESEYHYLFEKVMAFEETDGGHFDYAFKFFNNAYLYCANACYFSVWRRTGRHYPIATGFLLEPCE